MVSNQPIWEPQQQYHKTSEPLAWSDSMLPESESREGTREYFLEAENKTGRHTSKPSFVFFMILSQSRSYCLQETHSRLPSDLGDKSFTYF